MKEIQLNKQRSLIYCLVAILLCSLLFQYATVRNIIYKVYEWQIVQPETISGLAEVTILFLIFCLIIYFMRSSWSTLLIVITSLLFLIFHGLILPVIVCGLYFESIISIGRFTTKWLFKKERTKEYLIFFLIGLLVWSLVSMVCSLLGFGSFNDLRVVTLILLLISFTNGFNIPFVFIIIEKFRKLKKYEMVPAIFLLLIILIQFAKSNTLLVYEFDSIWYGLRPEAVLVGDKSFFDNLGFTSFVHVYPKLFEFFMIPVSNLGSYSYILSVNVLFFALIIYTVYLLFRDLNNSKFISLFFTCLIASIPALANMASTAKSDLFSTFLLILGVLYIWRWIGSLIEPEWTKQSGYLWFGILAFILSMGAKPTSMVYVPFLLLGICIYLLANKKKYKNKEKFIDAIGFNGVNLSLLIGTLLVFFGVCYRTYKLTGVPIYPILGSVWSSLGFEVKYPFLVKNVGETSASYELMDILSRWYHLLFDPQPYGHIIMLWIGNLGMLLICLFLLLNIFKIKRISKETFLVLVFPVCLTGIYYSTFLPNGGDGNTYLVPLILGLIGLLEFIAVFLFKFKKILFISLIIFIPFQFFMMFISHPSWSYGMSPIRVTVQYNNVTQEMKDKLFEYHGLLNIEKRLESTGEIERCIGLGDDYLLNQLSCGMETINASASNYLGNSKLFSDVESLREFMTWADIKYIIMPNTNPEEVQPIYNLLDEIRTKSQQYGGVISDAKFDLVLIDATMISKSDDWSSNKIRIIDGWYNIEDDYRWIGKNARMHILTGEEGKMKISGIVPDVYQQINMSIYVDDVLLTSERLKQGEFQVEYDLEKDKDMAIRIEMDNSFNPKEKGISNDMRELSIIINSIEIY
jgi:hypothetical protein